MIHHRSLSILVRPEIRRIDADCTAGAERVAINDALQCSEHGHPVMLCAAGQVVHLPPSIRYVRLFYPIRFVDLLNRLSVGSNVFLRKMAGRLYMGTVYVAELLYVFQFILASRSADSLYTVQVSLVGALYPEKTTVLCHDANPRTFYLSSLLRRRFSRIRYICCSHSLRKEILTGFPWISPARILVLHNAVDTRLFHMKRPSAARKKTFVFGYAGTWAPQKGTDILADVVQKVRSAGLDTKILFRIAGGIDLWDRPEWEARSLERLQTTVIKLGTFKNVTIDGKLTYRDLPAFYQSLDYLLFPSVYNEPFGNVLIESMASGTPPVAFSRGASREIISGGSGKILSLADAETMYQCICELIRQEAPAFERMSRLARSTVMKSFSAAKRWTRLERILFSEHVAEHAVNEL